MVTDSRGSRLAGLGLRSEWIFAEARRTGALPACLDWGERRMHLAGRFGAMLCSHCLQMGWLLQLPNTRALELTPRGARRISRMARGRAMACIDADIEPGKIGITTEAINA